MTRLLFACLAAVILAACGRFGVDLLPLPARDAAVLDGGAADAGPNEGGAADSGTSIGDGGGTPEDGGTPSDGGSAADGGGPEDAGMPDACPTMCENPNGTASCETGSCVTSCTTGYADCDGTPTNGCESNISSAAPTCGSCTNTCTNDNGTAQCASGICTPVCSAGFADCDSDPVNGCETSLTSTLHCGGCGNVCENAHGSTSCATGSCVPSCDAGFADCDGDPTNGCETNTDTDPMHCGSCGGACGNPNLICAGGACELSPCATGRGECDGDLAVACETDLTSSTSHCGFCGNACTVANGTPGCTMSACRVASCNTGYANCDGAVANGCEVNLRTSVSNCGACGTACTNPHGGTSCASSVCVPSCTTGYGDCDSSRQNGCETQLNTTSHCGSCGNVCPAVTGGTPVCNSGICGATCDLTGTYALKITLPTSWPDRTYVAGGSGPHVFWLRMTGTHSGNSIAAQLLECGRSVPPFDSGVLSNETYLFEIPNAVFDRSPAVLPTRSATITLGNSSPTASVSMPLTAFLIGNNLANPVTASWPSSQSGLASVDMDGDGERGVTAAYRNGGGFVQPRAGSTFSADRVSNPYIASRLVFSLGGNLTSCTRAAGAATVTRIDTRIFGCRFAGTTAECDSGERDFLDGNVLIYNLGSATYQMVKLTGSTTCAAVRSALP